MKKHLYSLFALFLISTGAFAQYCGGSGPGVCTPGTLAQPGLSPESINLPPFINGQATNTTIQLKNFNQVVFGGFNLTVQSLTIDTISNLPAGLCWKTNKTNNTFANSEDGCILVSGTTCAPPGQYKMYIIVTVNVGFTSQQVNADDAGLKYWLRVNNNGDATVAVDTNQTVPFYNVGYSQQTICTQCATFTWQTTGGVQNTSCATPNGAFTTVAFGGTAPYTYTFSGGAQSNTTGTFTGLQGGTYTVTATDANNCSGTTTATVTTTAPTINSTVGNNTANTLCVGGNGAFSISAGGGSSPYTYAITGSSNSTGNFSNLAAGTYTVTITDANSCPGTASVTVANNAPTLTVTSSTTPDTLCNGNSGGFALSTTGGAGPYNYAFGGSTNTTGNFGNLAGGSYTVSVTDANGCTATQSVTVATQTATVTLTTSSTNAASASSPTGSATATPAGGSAPYTYTWSNAQTTQTATNVLPGNYTVTATDANGCSATGSVTVSFNSGIADNAEIKNLSVFPNPASTTLNINATFAQTSDVVIEVVNTNGAKVLSVNAGRTDAINERLDVRNLSKGVYHLRLLVNGNVSTQTIVIE